MVLGLDFACLLPVFALTLVGLFRFVVTVSGLLPLWRFCCYGYLIIHSLVYALCWSYVWYIFGICVLVYSRGYLATVDTIGFALTHEICL